MQSVNNTNEPGPNESPRILLRFGVAIVCNIVLIFLFPTLALQSTVSHETQSKFIAASVSLVPLVVLLPVLRAPDFSYKLAAIILWLFPAFIFIGSVWYLFVLSWR